MDYNQAAGQQTKQPTPILNAMHELEQAITVLEERGSELQARLEPVLQTPALKIANAPTERGAGLDGRVPTPVSPILAGLQALRVRVDTITTRVQLLNKNLDV